MATTIPAEQDLLCETCGYTLNGLPDDSNCPECGRQIVESVPTLRSRPAWEDERVGLLGAFFKTTFSVLFRPTRFYRTLATRGSVARARTFGLVHMLITALMVSQAIGIHARWLDLAGILGRMQTGVVALSLPLTFLFLVGITQLAGRLTAWEAAYRGLRMPRQAVLRGLYYHAVHYLPVAAVALVTVAGYRQLVERGITDVRTLPTYLYVLSAEVIAGSLYLFWTYWIGMRNMMYANR